MTDKNNKEEYQRATDSVKEIFNETVKMGGTISGEHGVGSSEHHAHEVYQEGF
jgi:glycolate oxidase